MLDVTDPEPSPEGHLFYGMDNVIRRRTSPGSAGAEASAWARGCWTRHAAGCPASRCAMR